MFSPPFPDRDATGAVRAHWTGPTATNLLSKRHGKATPFHVARRHCVLATTSRSGRYRRCPRALGRDERKPFQFVYRNAMEKQPRSTQRVATVFSPPFPDRDATGAVHAHWTGPTATPPAFPPPFPDRDATGAVHAHWIGPTATNLLSKRHEKATPFHIASRHCALATISRSGRHRRCPRALDRDERNQFQFVHRNAMQKQLRSM